jgi:hypothetical protein
MPVKLNSTGGGSITLDAPSTASTFTLTLPAATDTVVGLAATQTLTNKTLTSPTISGTPVMSASTLTSGTANTVSSTSVDYTGIPSWVKRITIMFRGVSTSGTSRHLIQIGSGTFTTSGYSSIAGSIGSGVNSTNSSGSITTGFVMNGYAMVATRTYSGHAILTNVSGNIWVCSGVRGDTTNELSVDMFGGTVSLAGTLDRVRLTTVNGTDTFDAGTVNILYE